MVDSVRVGDVPLSCPPNLIGLCFVTFIQGCCPKSNVAERFFVGTLSHTFLFAVEFSLPHQSIRNESTLAFRRRPAQRRVTRASVFGEGTRPTLSRAAILMLLNVPDNVDRCLGVNRPTSVRCQRQKLPSWQDKN